MSAVNWLIYLPALQAVVCQPCGYGMQGLETHLLTHHSELPFVERRALIAHYRSLPLLPSDDFRPPPGPAPYIPALPLYRGGYRCSVCRGEGRTFLRTTGDGIRDHCREVHEWVNPRSAGRSSALALSQYQRMQPWVEGVACQRLYKGGKGASYFEVSAPPPTPLSRSIPPPPQDRIQVRIDRELEAQAEQLTRAQEEQRNIQRYSSEVSF
jgi:hypothetical protein